MVARRAASRFEANAIARVLLAVVLAVSLAPTVPARAVADDGAPARVPIEDMLAAGDYVEGEAIAIMRAGEQPDVAAQTEELAQADADSVELAVEGAAQTESALDDAVALRAQDASADAYAVQLVVDHERTTEQILRDLYDDPDVVSAEPNYTMDAAEAYGTDADAQAAVEAAADIASAAQGAGTLQPANVPEQLGARATGADIDPYTLTNTGDLTGLQWAYGEGMNTADTTSTPAASGNGYTLNVPDWTAYRANPDARPNASGTVCIMDMGLDPKHPDLKDVLYEFSVEQQREYGCGPYGYNASGDDYPVYAMRPSGEHGMHVAGIVAAAWNRQGTSGVAHGIKIFGVNVFGGNGQVMEMSSVMKGFQLLVKAAKDVNLKAVNCSWGTKQTSFALGTMVNELGKQGVNTVIATGNDHENLDDRMELASQATNSPYAIRVNAAGPDGKPTMFTSYGQTASDVFAPGQAILSTYPVAVSLDSGKNLSLSRFLRFFPAGAGAQNLLAYERFDSASRVKFYDANPALDASAQELTPATETVGYGDRHSVSFNVKSLKKEDYRKTGERQYDVQGLVGKNGYFYMAIPVNADKVADAKWVSMSLAVNDGFRPAGGIAALTYKKADGGTAVEIDTASSNVLKRGWGSGASAGMYQVQWNTASFFSEAIGRCVNEAHARVVAGEKFSTETEAGTFTYRDPGEVSGLLGWEKDGNTYIVAKVALGDLLEAPADTTTLYIDNVAVGSSYAGAGAYANMSGTSMASPAVAGCLAVIAKDEPESATLTDAQLEKEARERAAKLMASVDYDADLAKLCRTGGRVNLAANPGFTKKAPLITCAESDGSTLSVSGYFFGTSGSLEIDGTSFTPSKWADEKITVPVSSLERGRHVVKVVNADNAVSQVIFSHASAQGSGAALYEHDLALPTSVPAFNMQDKIWGSLVAVDGAIYGITTSAKYMLAQGMWRYDIAKDSWSSIAMPDGFKDTEAAPSRMAAYNGSLYLIGMSKNNEDDYSGATCLWRYDSAKDSWTRVDMTVPSGAAICAHKGKLFLMSGIYPEERTDLSGAHFALLDPEKRTITKVNESNPDAIEFSERLTVVSTNNNMYCYSFGQDNPDERAVTTRFHRLAYNEKTNTMSVEDLSKQFGTMAPSVADSGEGNGYKAHLALAGLPDGVAVIGSKEKDADTFDLGHDTFVIYDNAKAGVHLNRTSTYQRAFDPMAVYYNGRLYAMGYSPAETHIAYFRATDLWNTGTVTKKATCTAAGERVFKCLYRTASYTEAIPALGHTWDAGKVTKAAAPGVAGVRTFTCKTCGAKKTEAIAALPGGATGKTYKVSGHTYKVTNNAKNTATFAKAKAAKSVKVPATVKIKGKTYKVATIGAKAFASAKKKLTTVSIGKNVKTIGTSAFAGCVKLTKVKGGAAVTKLGASAFKGAKKLATVTVGKKVATIGKQAFANCAKLKTVKGGAAVKTIGASAFAGCKVLASCAPVSSKKLAKVGASAFKGAKKLATITLKSKKLKKAAVKKSLSGSSAKTVKVNVGKSKANKTYAKKYKKFFTKANAGKKATVRAQVAKLVTV